MGSQLFVPRTWHLGLSADRYAKDQVAEEDPGTREREVENRVTLSASRTFGDRLTLVGRLPFADRTITTSSDHGSRSGMSDPELVAHYRLSAPHPGTWLSASIGLRPGWGRHDAQRDGVRAEEHLQPGTGAMGIEPGLSFSHMVGDAHPGSIFGSAIGRFNGRNDAGYHYGNAILANLGYERRIGARVDAILETNFRYAAKDDPTPGEADPNTGGSMLYLAPRIVVKLDRTLFLRLGVQVPIVKDLYGDQDEKVNVFTGLTVRF
ncbi:MAG: hypothetical protein DMF83_08755 [Acidobacteria bacterium]|nr:MAG: hypothetical protein DMF83_08755 [Acidobacteriota bacterium]